MKTAATWGLALFMVSSFANKVANAEELINSPSWFSSRVSEPKPISSLPSVVVAPDGEVTLYADFTSAKNGSIPLYLVNRSQHHIAFPSQDGDPYIKLEGSLDGQNWDRAQSHRSSWCGNSYHPTPVLKPGTYFQIPGLFPVEGQPRTVRYRMYQEGAYLVTDQSELSRQMLLGEAPNLPLVLVSNVGFGKVRPADINASRDDNFAIPYGSFETVREHALGTRNGRPGGRRNSDAIASLGRFPTTESLALLIELSIDPDREASFAAMRGLSKLGLLYAPAERVYQDYLRSDDSQLRAAAVRALEQRPLTIEVIKYAKEQLSHEDHWVRCFGLGVLAQHCKSDPEIKAFINSIYDDPDPKIQSIFETLLYPTCINYKERGYKGRFNESRR